MASMKSVVKEGPTMLLFGRTNNFMAWKTERLNVCCKEFGFLANVLKTNEPYVPDPVQPEDYMPAAAEDEENPLPALGVAAIAALRLEAEKQRNKIISKLKSDAPRLYATLWESISLESKEEIRQHPDYEQADLAQNPNVLWTIIVETHVTAIHGAGPEMRELEIVTLKTKFNAIRQRPNMTIGEFKKEFDDQIDVITGAGVDPLPQPELAILFLTKLDPTRYAPMMAQLTNNATLGIAFPQTLHAAWTISSGWKGATMKQQPGGEMQSVFILADDYRKEAGRGRGRGGRGRNGRGQRGTDTRDGRSDLKGQQPFLPVVENRTCRGCLTKGHLWANCPDNPDKMSVLVTTDEPDYEDQMSTYDAAFVCTTGEKRDVILFTSDDILLDNQASRSLFNNSKFLTTIEKASPFYIGGIDSSSKGLLVEQQGCFTDYGNVAFQPKAAANVISIAEALDRGCTVTYSSPDDAYTLGVCGRDYVFSRKYVRGRLSSHYTWTPTTHNALIATVAENIRNYTPREVSQARAARELMLNLGHASSAATIDMLDSGILNCPVTKTDVRNADTIFGPSVPSLKGKTVKRTSTASPLVIAPRVTQVQQIMSVDIFFVKKIAFLLGVLSPLGLSFCVHLKNRGIDCVSAGLSGFLATALSRGFDAVVIKTDGEGAVGAMSTALNSKGIVIDTSGPGQHVPVVERKIQTIKQRVRSYENSLPYIMTRLLLIWCVLFCVSRLNMQPSRTSHDRISPLEQFTGRKLDASKDLRTNFGDYIHATVPNPDNTLAPRTQGCVALVSTGNSTGSVKMWCLSTDHIVTRDQFKKLPMPDLVINFITKIAISEGFSRGSDPTTGPLDDDPRDLDTLSPLPNMMALPNDAGVVHLADITDNMPNEGVNKPADSSAMQSQSTVTVGASATVAPPTIVHPANNAHDTIEELLDVSTAAAALLDLAGTSTNGDKVMILSVKAALRDRKEETTTAMTAELTQMEDKKVWHGVNTIDLNPQERRAIISSKMFLKDKYLASGVFDKFKARLVAGGHLQDKSLYENLSSPTAALTSVFTTATIAASEGRQRVIIDIGGAFLNADMAPTGVHVHMRLSKVMTDMLVNIDKANQKFVNNDGTMVVRLDKALYGCVEASNLWYNDLRGKLSSDGFQPNPYDKCVFNKVGASGHQITVVVHVDDLFVTCVSELDIDSFCKYLKKIYPETKETRGVIIDYIGMTFDFSTAGEVKVTMSNCVNDILSECGVTTVRATPATSTLFDIRDAPKASPDDEKYFRTYVAKMLYVAKRVKPECLAAVAFLCTRVNVCDLDDMAKLYRLLGYVLGTRERGIVFRIGKAMTVNVFIDAAYGVHRSSAKSHTGCVIVLGEQGPLYAKSCKQKIITKSSTEAELVGLSDTASQGIHTRRFLMAQGYDIEPVKIYQDNMSCIALMKRGCPGSDKSRHIEIRYFWLAERVEKGEVVIEHLGTEHMFANILTKPIQGAQFEFERLGLTNWTVSN